MIEKSCGKTPSLEDFLGFFLISRKICKFPIADSCDVIINKPNCYKKLFLKLLNTFEKILIIESIYSSSCEVD